jgi:hypothetical protein
LEVSSNPAFGAWNPHLAEQVLWVGGSQAVHGRLAGLEFWHFRWGPFAKWTIIINDLVVFVITEVNNGEYFWCLFHKLIGIDQI